MKRQLQTIILPLFFILTLGILLRYHALSPFNIYPDSYQSLIVAQNINTYHSVIGYLGPHGMLYPDFIGWTRPGFPLLILFITLFTNNIIQSAQTISFFLGVLTIPLSFFLTKTIFRSTRIGLCGALLLAISFHHSVWGGFIMTETTGIFFLTLFLLSFLKDIREINNKKTKNPHIRKEEIINGILFSLAVLTRYEYVLLLFPISMMLFLTKKQPLQRIIIFILTSFSIIALFIVILSPTLSFDIYLLKQIKHFWPLLLVYAIAFPLLIFLTKRLLQKIIDGLLYSLIVLFIASFFKDDLSGYNAFILLDFFLVGIFLIGTFFLRKIQPLLIVFILTAITIMGIVYYRVNPTMDRYLTHLIPFLLIPGSVALNKLFFIQKVNKWKILRQTLFISLILIQTLITYHGFRYLHDNSWFRQNYEETAAKKLEPYVSKNMLLITAQPEPYFLITGLSTRSIIDRYPFVIQDTISPKQQIVIINDMGMHTYFPQFTQYITKYLSTYQKETFWINERYHITHLSNKETVPVTIYVLSWKDFQTIIRQNKDN